MVKTGRGMPSRLESDVQRLDVNCAPQSEDMSPGIPKQVIQWQVKALAQASVLMEASGIACGHLVTPVNNGE